MVEIKVAKVVDKYTLVLNKGIADGINDGDRFLIFEKGEMIYDPDTEIELEQVEIPKGVVIVKNVQSKISFAESNEFFEKETEYSSQMRRSGLTIGRGIIPRTEMTKDMKPLKNPKVGDFARKLSW